MHAYFGGPAPTANDGAPVVHLGEANVEGACSYRVSFRIPDLPPGIYAIVLIEHNAAGAAPLESIDFRVTA